LPDLTHPSKKDDGDYNDDFFSDEIAPIPNTDIINYKKSINDYIIYKTGHLTDIYNILRENDIKCIYMQNLLNSIEKGDIISETNKNAMVQEFNSRCDRINKIATIFKNQFHDKNTIISDEMNLIENIEKNIVTIYGHFILCIQFTVKKIYYKMVSNIITNILKKNIIFEKIDLYNFMSIEGLNLNLILTENQREFINMCNVFNDAYTDYKTNYKTNYETIDVIYNIDDAYHVFKDRIKTTEKVILFLIDSYNDILSHKNLLNG
jgi:hypothetical protein